MKKTRVMLKALGLLTMLFLLPGCLDIYLTTTVHPNGSLTRTMVFEGDSADIVENSLYMLVDEKWDTAWYTVDKEKLKFVADRKFKNAREMNRILNPADTNRLQIRSEARLEKRFRWFFTYLDYTETMLATNPFKTIGAEEYLTENELRLIKMDDEQREKDTTYQEEEFAQAEKNFELFIARSVLVEFVSLFITTPELVTASGLTKEEFENSREALLLHLQKNSDFTSLEDMLYETARYFDMEFIESLDEKYKDHYANMASKLNFVQGLWDDKFTISLRMPGLMMDTGSKELVGNNSSWKIDPFKFYLDDFSMQCESRIVNTWAFVISGIIIIIALISISTGLLKKRKK